MTRKAAEKARRKRASARPYTTPRVLAKRHIGRVAAIAFWDHVEDAHKLVLTEAYGRIISLTKDAVTLQKWNTFERDDLDVDDTDVLSIVRSTITRNVVFPPIPRPRNAPLPDG